MTGKRADNLAQLALFGIEPDAQRQEREEAREAVRELHRRVEQAAGWLRDEGLTWCADRLTGGAR